MFQNHLFSWSAWIFSLKSWQGYMSTVWFPHCPPTFFEYSLKIYPFQYTKCICCVHYYSKDWRWYSFIPIHKFFYYSRERVAEVKDKNLSEIALAVSSPFLIYRSMVITGKTERRNISTYAFPLLYISILWYLQINSLSCPCSASHMNQICELFLWLLLPFAFFCKTLPIWYWSFSYKSPPSGVFLSCLPSFNGRPSVKPIMVLL